MPPRRARPPLRRVIGESAPRRLREPISSSNAYAADLRCWASWLTSIGVESLQAHRAHVDAYARWLEEQGRSRATIAPRLAGLQASTPTRPTSGLVSRSPVGRVRRPKASDHSPRLGLDEQELRAFLRAAAASSRRDHALARLLALNGLRVSAALGADVEALSQERGHRTLEVVRKGGRRATIPLAPITAQAIHAYLGGRTEGPLFVARSGLRVDPHAAAKTIRRLARLAGFGGWRVRLLEPARTGSELGFFDRYTFGGDRRPCAGGDPSQSAASTSVAAPRLARSASGPVARAAAAPPRDREETESVARETQLAAGGDPLVDEFAHCDQWAQPPTEPGSTVVACDQRQLDAFIGAGLTGDGGGGPRIVTRDGTVSDIPATYSTDDPSKLGTIGVVGTGAAAGIYAARLTPDGSLDEARFPEVELPRNQRLIVRFRGAVAELVTAKQARVVATVATTRTPLGAFPTAPRARAPYAIRRGRSVLVTWRGSRNTRFMVSAGPTRGAARRRRVADIHTSRAGRYHARVRLRRGERWIGLVAYRGSSVSPVTTVRLRTPRGR